MNIANNKYIANTTKLLIVISLLTSFYLFSRFTVDDAFITWRYGLNFISNDIWAYNPIEFDLTQAYTNPIFAILSIIPPLTNIDVVLFFKLISIILVVFFVGYMKFKHQATFETLLFIAIPSSIIHIFSGLETIWFTFFLVFLYDALDENKLSTSIIITLILFLIRPESWLLTVLVPCYFLFKRDELNPIKKITGLLDIKNNRSEFFISLSILVAGLFILLYGHSLYFDSYMPNTFHIKSGNAKVTSTQFFTVFLTFLPALLLSITLLLRKNTSLFYVFFILFLGMTINYSSSKLAMNYVERFPFHIYSPLFFIVLISSRAEKNINSNIKTLIGYISSFLILSVFCFLTLKPVALVKIAEYYPRLLLSHGKLGEAIAKSSIDAVAMGDAGITAFHSNAKVLDINGLASTMVARNGLSDYVFDKYDPDLIIFYSRPNKNFEVINHQKQNNLYKWATKNNLSHLCDVIYRHDYSLTLYTKENIPSKELTTVCDNSKKNMIKPMETIDYLLTPPWYFWHS